MKSLGYSINFNIITFSYKHNVIGILYPIIIVLVIIIINDLP